MSNFERDAGQSMASADHQFSLSAASATDAMVKWVVLKDRHVRRIRRNHQVRLRFLMENGQRRQGISMRRQNTATAPLLDGSDSELARLTLSGDEHAFETLIGRYCTLLSRYALHFLGNSAQIDDILQIIWLRLYLALPELQARTSFRSWLFLVAHNLCIDEIHRQNGDVISLSTLEQEASEEEWPSPSFLLDTRLSPEGIAERHELQRIIRQAIDALPPGCRDVVSLWYSDRLSVNATARQLGLAPATVRNVISQAKSLLRARLAPYVALEEPARKNTRSSHRRIPQHQISGNYQ